MTELETMLLGEVRQMRAEREETDRRCEDLGKRLDNLTQLLRSSQSLLRKLDQSSGK